MVRNMINKNFDGFIHDKPLKLMNLDIEDMTKKMKKFVMMIYI